MIIISGLQGVGKTTLINLLLKERPILRLSVSCTTRPRRVGEGEGEYEFINEETFNLREMQGYFMEVVTVHGYKYGTPKKYFTANTVFNVTASSIDNFKQLIGGQKYISIFISAPLDIIKQRIEARRDPDCIHKKIMFGESELLYQQKFTHLILNDDDINEALTDMLNIVDQYLKRD